MRINIVTGFFLPVPPVAGGATEKIWHRLAQAFAAQGHDVTFISRTWPDFPDRETRAGVKHLRLRGHDHTRSLPRNLWHDTRWGLRVAPSLPPADVTICNAVTLPLWLRRLRPAAGRVVAVVARMPKGQGRFFGGVDLVFSLSEAVTEKLLAENPRLAARIVSFPFPIDWSLHAIAAREKPADPVITIGYSGRIHPEKGVDLLIDAAGRLTTRRDLPPWRLALIGPWAIPHGGGGDRYRDDVLARLQTSLGDRFSLQGPEFDPARLAQRYAAMDIFCYPSLADTGETFGVAVAEGMAAGAAPVVSNLACFEDLVRDGETGLVFDRRGPTAGERLADALARLLLDAPLRRSLAARAQEHVRRFDYAESARSVLAHLARLVARDAT